MLIGGFLILELLPEFRDEFLEFEVFFPDDALADLLIGWDNLGAWPAARDALAGSGGGYLL